MTDHDAYDEGYDTYWEGVDVADNPYDEEAETAKRESWEVGWRKAREHDYDESDG
jgi:hypothetical protein